MVAGPPHTEMDEANEDNEIRARKALGSFISDLVPLIDSIVWKPANPELGRRQVHSKVKKQSLEHAIGLIEPFQEEPQILDVHLKDIIPTLVTAFLENLRRDRPRCTANQVSSSYGICKILYTFCKVRGEKVIVSFFNNEARHLEPVLTAYESLSAIESTPDDNKALSWEERYIYMLWLSHLMLIPFDLQTVSSPERPPEIMHAEQLNLLSSLPVVSLRLINISLTSLKSATKERGASAALFVRLSLRPDMRQLGLLDALIDWAMTKIDARRSDTLSVHEALGILAFLSGLAASASPTELGHHFMPIFKLCKTIIDPSGHADLSSSAVARKLVIKTLRDLVVLALRSHSENVDVTSLLEDVVETLLNSLADGDSPVRYAASKALSMIALKLDPSMAGEVIEAILGCLDEDVLWDGPSRNLTAVNPLRWHGLTLTLSHLLYRRAPSADLLPDVLNALVLSLGFEQRSATGSSVGTNVRDAACFGMWSLSRRYTTHELLAIKTSLIRAADDSVAKISVPQYLATHLVVAACLDPAGNIRRGSSAALQELIGRHPNIVREGIALVQVVDYHAVGLRERAMVDVAFGAARLDQLYWNALFASLLDWRGIGAVDTASRSFAATSIGRLSICLNFKEVIEMMGPPPVQREPLPSRLIPRGTTFLAHQLPKDSTPELKTARRNIMSVIRRLKPRQKEERHGLLLALSNILAMCVKRSQVSVAIDEGNWTSCPITVENLEDLTAYFPILVDLSFEKSEFNSASQRPELTAIAVCSLITTLCSIPLRIREMGSDARILPEVFDEPAYLLGACLCRNDDSLRNVIGTCARNLLSAMPQKDSAIHASVWIDHLSPIGPTEVRIERMTSHDVALGAVFDLFPWRPILQKRIINTLTSRSTGNVSIETKVRALQSLTLIIESLAEPQPSDSILEQNNYQNYAAKISDTLLSGLTDYTVNERGDVGSLVRIAALGAFRRAWSLRLVRTCSLAEQLESNVVRLALEKLDKVRSQAKLALETTCFETLKELAGVSSYPYFAFWLRQLRVSSNPKERTAILEGYLSSAGMGSESIVQASREALLDLLEKLPTDRNDHDFTLVTVADILLQTFKENLSNERVLLPLLEVLAFLLDMQVLQCLDNTTFKWRNFLSLVQKSHYKSNHMHKLHLALDVYRGLCDVDVIRADVLSKLVSMLAHPFPKIRIAAAEILFVVTGDAELKSLDWSKPAKEMKDTVAVLKGRVLVK